MVDRAVADAGSDRPPMTFHLPDGSAIEVTFEELHPRRAPAPGKWHRPPGAAVEQIAAWDALVPPTQPRRRAEVLIDVFGDLCQLCGNQVDMTLTTPHPASFSVDHRVPTSRGGPHEMGNLDLVHRYCNMAKSNLVVPEPTREQYSELLEEAVLRFANPAAHTPSELWAARDRAALLEGRRAMYESEYVTAKETGLTEVYLSRIRDRVTDVTSQLENAVAIVATLQSRPRAGTL